MGPGIASRYPDQISRGAPTASVEATVGNRAIFAHPIAKIRTKAREALSRLSSGDRRVSSRCPDRPISRQTLSSANREVAPLVLRFDERLRGSDNPG